jgi:hypothetical protein
MKEEQFGLLTLTVKVRLEQAKDKELPEVMVYAFDQTGQFLTSAPLPKGEQGEVKLQLPSELRGTTVRVLLGSGLAEEPEEMPAWMTMLMQKGEEQKKVPSPAILVSRGAYEKRVRLHTSSEILNLAVFPPDWTKWLLCGCVVRGRLIKRLTLPDGTTKDLGVCHACVKIYEVDKFPKLILRLPDRDLFRLRDDLRIIFEKPLPKPQVWPPPPPPPPEQYRIPGLTATLGLTKTGTYEKASSSAFNPQPEPPVEAVETEMGSVPSKTQIMTELEPIFMATSATELRTLLIAKADLLVHFVCIWEWLHVHFHTDLIKWVCTDEQGRFETIIWYPCGGDKPDLYFKAVQCIGGTLHTLYDPGVACHTYWNYPCGTEVVLEVTDPAARVCVPPDPVIPPPGITLWVMPYAVGGTRLDQIKPKWQKNLNWHAIDVDPTKRGLTDYGSIVDAPFGDRLGFRLGYSNSIPIKSPNKPFYYRWLYKKETATEWSEFVAPVAETIVRHYVKELPGKLPTFPVCTLGPKGVDGKHLYRFKPHDPSECGDFIPGGYNYWPTDDWFGDIYASILNSLNLPGGVDSSAGKYKIKLEIYDPDGKRIPPGPGTFQFIVPTGVDTDGVTILARLANTDPAAGLVEIEDEGFVFYLHVDNRKCTALIEAPTIGGVSAGDACGFLRYASGDQVRIAFHSLHPANFATFYFQITRAATAVNSAGGEVAATTAGVYTGDGNGNFAKNDFSTGALLGPCAEAAFAENLWVYAKATNGWVRLLQYDAFAVRAFALAPKTS